MVRYISEQLVGIGGQNSIRNSDHKIIVSVVDAIGHALISACCNQLGATTSDQVIPVQTRRSIAKKTLCVTCGNLSVIPEGNCFVCDSCGNSKC